jgi:phosphate-selective porin OprO/OprP
VNGRYGKPDQGELRLRARPEAFPAPYFVDTEKFPADHSTTASVEAYYRPGPLLIGSEYFVQMVAAPEAGDPLFHGGDMVVCWLATGETRAYNTLGGYFKSVSPADGVRGRTGRGAGRADLVHRPRRRHAARGKFWRFTPMVNWHLSDNLRLEVSYGYGTLDRFDLRGTTQFFQSRIQFQF